MTSNQIQIINQNQSPTMLILAMLTLMVQKKNITHCPWLKLRSVFLSHKPSFTVCTRCRDGEHYLAIMQSVQVRKHFRMLLPPIQNFGRILLGCLEFSLGCHLILRSILVVYAAGGLQGYPELMKILSRMLNKKENRTRENGKVQTCKNSLF